MGGSNDTDRSLQVESREHVVISSESTRFRESYRRIRPRTAEALKELLGLSVEEATALRRAEAYEERYPERIRFVAVEELDSRDPDVRARAHRDAGDALEHYVLGLEPEAPVRMRETFERYLHIWSVVVSVVALPELVEVNDGATLTILDAQLVQGKRILIHGTGRIVCYGVLKLEVDSIIGN